MFERIPSPSDDRVLRTIPSVRADLLEDGPPRIPLHRGSQGCVHTQAAQRHPTCAGQWMSLKGGASRVGREA